MLDRLSGKQLPHMADVPPYPGAPRWVKVFGLIAVVVITLFVVLMFARGPGGHGPHLHRPGASQKP